MSLFNENGAFLLKSAIFIKMENFYRLGTFSPPAASPGGLPGGPGMGSHWATSGILDFQETAQIVTFIKVILEVASCPARR